MNNDMPDGVVHIYHLAYHYSYTQSSFPLGLLDSRTFIIWQKLQLSHIGIINLKIKL